MKNEVLYSKFVQITNKFSHELVFYPVCLGYLEALAIHKISIIPENVNMLENVLLDIVAHLSTITSEVTEMQDALEDLVTIVKDINIYGKFAGNILEAIHEKASATKLKDTLKNFIAISLKRKPEMDIVFKVPAFKKYKERAPMPSAHDEVDEGYEDWKEPTLKDIFSKKELRRIEHAEVEIIPKKKMTSLTQLQALLNENKYQIKAQGIKDLNEVIGRVLLEIPKRVQQCGGLLEDTLLNIDRRISQMQEITTYDNYIRLHNNFFSVVNNASKKILLIQLLWFEYIVNIEESADINLQEKEAAVKDILQNNPELEIAMENKSKETLQPAGNSFDSPSKTLEDYAEETLQEQAKRDLQSPFLHSSPN